LDLGADVVVVLDLGADVVLDVGADVVVGHHPREDAVLEAEQVFFLEKQVCQQAWVGVGV